MYSYEERIRAATRPSSAGHEVITLVQAVSHWQTENEFQAQHSVSA